MADNYLAKDGNGASVTFRAIDNAGVLSPVHVLESIPLATGAATSALQSTGNTTLSDINGKLPGSLGQKLTSASMAVVLASDQSAVPVTGSVTVSGTVAATQSGTWNIADGGGSLTVDGTVAATQSGSWSVSLTGTMLALIAGSATIGSIASITTSIVPGTGATNLGKARDAAAGATDTGVAALMIRRDSPSSVTSAAGDYEPPQIDANGRQWVHPSLGTTGGSTPYKLVSAATTNATSVKASAGTIQSVVAMNTHATAIAYLKLYNLASAPTVGTSTPVAVYALAPNGGGVAINFADGGIAYGTGIALAITGGAADTDTTAVALSQVVVNLTYV